MPRQATNESDAIDFGGENRRGCTRRVNERDCTIIRREKVRFKVQLSRDVNLCLIGPSVERSSPFGTDCANSRTSKV